MTLLRIALYAMFVSAFIQCGWLLGQARYWSALLMLGMGTLGFFVVRLVPTERG